MSTETRATWHTTEHDSTWDRVKAAFRNDWEQTKNDFGVDGTRDIDQDVDDTVKQMAGKQSTMQYGEYEFEEIEPAFRYGHAAKSHYSSNRPAWNDELSSDLQRDYKGDWKRDEPLIRHAYMYSYPK